MEEFKMKKMTFFSLIICAFALSVCFVNAQSKTASLNDEVVTDIDGNEYSTVTIGTQTWLVENLKTTRYRNGDEIGTTTTFDYSAEATPKYQFAYVNKESLVASYGRLYTWYAATDPRGLAPIGYRIPTDQDLINLATYLIENGDIYSYDKSKNTGTVDANNQINKALASTTTLWTNTALVGTPGNDKAANNASGLSLIAGGYRKPSATSYFQYSNQYATLWTSTESLTNTANAISRFSAYDKMYFNTKPAGDNKKWGLSVRCIKGDTMTGVESVKRNTLNFHFYPSLVKDYLTISFAASLAEKVKLDILSIDGKLVYQNEYLSNSGLDKISVQLSHLDKGLYLCRLNCANATNVVKFTKQ